MNPNKTQKGKVLVKMCIFCKQESIKKLFLRELNAEDIFNSSKYEIGMDFSISTHTTQQWAYTIQWWLINNKSRFEIMIPSFLLATSGIVFFYQIGEKIDQTRLKLVKSGMPPPIPILFVGYDSVLQDHPELIDQNIPTIQKYFPDSNSCYISVDQPDVMDHVLEELIGMITLQKKEE